MTFNNSTYSILECEDEYPHTDLAPFYTQAHDISTVLDPPLGADENMFPLEQPTMQRFLDEEDNHRLWEVLHWTDSFSMGISSCPATPTLESNGRSSSPGSPRLSSTVPNHCRSITQASLQQYGELTRPLTPLTSGILTSTPDAFSDEEHPNPQTSLAGLIGLDEPQERTGNTIHVRPLAPPPSFIAGSQSGSPRLPLKEQNPTKDAPETIQPVHLMSPPMQPDTLPKVFTRPQNRPNATPGPRYTDRDRRPKQPAKNTSPNRVTKPRHRAPSTPKGSMKLNFARNYTNSIPVVQHLSDLSCQECDFSCRDFTTLEKHIKSQHARPFTCIFQFAGCPARFAAKNEWKRHVISQHVVLRVYNCTLDGCGRAKGIPGRSQTTYVDMNGKQFNRKDLYDSHMRRMHPQPATKKLSPRDWEQRRQTLLEESIHERCKLPTHMECPNPDCTQVFEGEDAWDHRMEHIARHMEMAASGEAEEVPIGGDNDHTLLEWASSPEVEVIRRVSGGWKVCYPAKEKSPTRYRKRK